MKRSLCRTTASISLTMTCAMGAAAVLAQPGTGADYPARAVRLIVPFAAGGPVDIIARSLTPAMARTLGQQVIVDNRGGAGSTIGTDMAAKAPPDGHTLLMVSGSFVINPAMIASLPYDSIRDFAAVSIIAEVPAALVVHPSLPAAGLRQFIALAKSHPGALNYSSPGRGTVGHLSAELFSALAGVRMVHVPYKGAGPAMIDLMAGQVQLLFAALPGVIRESRQGRLRMLAQAGRKRSPSAPDVPTFVESGLPDFVVVSGFGLLAPAGTPRAVIDRVRRALLDALADADVDKRLQSLGADKVGSTPEEQARFIRDEITRWQKVTKHAGIEPR